MKALIPAAGLGTRWYPWSRIVPKELLPLGKYPAIHYILEEAVASGISEIGIIINETKSLIKAYVDQIWKLAQMDITVMWFYQGKPHGVADALFCAKEWIQNEPVAVLYPDEIHPPKGGLTQLFRAYEASSGCWIGLTTNQQKRRQSVLKIAKIEKNVFKINGYFKENCSCQIGYGTGRYILDLDFANLINSLPQNVSDASVGTKEVDDVDLFMLLWNKGVRGIVLDEPIFDIGTPENFCSAMQEFICY